MSRSLSILMFHRVLPEVDPLRPDDYTAQEFDRIVAALVRWFRVLPLDEAIARMDAGTLPSRAVALTFDDGYADNAELALPILTRHGASATFFVSTGFLGGEVMWNDRVIEAIRGASVASLTPDFLDGRKLSFEDDAQRFRATRTVLDAIRHRSPAERAAAVERLCALLAAPPAPRQMMTPDQVRELRAAGMLIGAHTISHPILSSLDDLEAAREIRGSKAHLEELLGERVGLFAYPNGVPDDDYGRRDVDLVADAGFDAAVSTAWGCASSADGRFELPRMGPWDRAPWKLSLRLLHAAARTEPARQAALAGS